MHYLVPEYRGSVNGKAGSDPASQTPAEVLVPLEAVTTLNGSGFASNLGA
jgi:hypothetical protein